MFVPVTRMHQKLVVMKKEAKNYLERKECFYMNSICLSLLFWSHESLKINLSLILKGCERGELCLHLRRDGNAATKKVTKFAVTKQTFNRQMFAQKRDRQEESNDPKPFPVKTCYLFVAFEYLF